jgi:glutamine amidotransferase
VIAVVDYDMGNPGSILNMLGKIGQRGKLVSSREGLMACQGLILPGVGHFDMGMRHLANGGLIEALRECVIEHKKPILGVCLGMQLFARRSEEGDLPGLGWIDGEVRRFSTEAMGNKRLRIPHMGWNVVVPAKNTDLFPPNESLRFYHVHSYHIVLDDPRHALTWTRYGYPFVSGVEKGNIVGVQFHPEKSHRFGMDFLRRFAARTNAAQGEDKAGSPTDARSA